MTPPRFLVSLVKLLLPRASREHVLGDLHERYASPIGYVRDAASVVPAEIIGQIRKSTPLPYIALEAFLVYASFFAAPRLFGDADGPFFPSLHPAPPGSIWSHASTSQLLCLTAVVMAGLLWRDAHPESIFSQRKMIAAQKEAGLRLSRVPFFAALRLTAGTYLVIYFSCGAVTFTQVFLFHRLESVFPGITTMTRGEILCGLSVITLRLWIAMRQRSLNERKLKHQN